MQRSRWKSTGRVRCPGWKLLEYRAAKGQAGSWKPETD